MSMKIVNKAYIESLQRMWNEQGYPQSKIAEILGVSKNSVAGDLHRLKRKGYYFKPRTTANTYPRKSPMVNPVRYRVPGPPQDNRQKLTREVLPLPVDVPSPSLITDVVPEDRQCRYIGPQDETCSMRRDGNRSYCREHCLIVYAQPRR